MTKDEIKKAAEQCISMPDNSSVSFDVDRFLELTEPQPQSSAANEGESKLPLQYEDGADYCTVRDAQGRDFALTMQPDLMKAMESALSDDIARLMRGPDARQAAEKPAIDAEIIAKIDHFLEREENDRGYEAFVLMRRIWPQLKALTITPAQPTAKPVAWREEQFGPGKGWYYSEKPWSKDAQPLYAAQPPAAPVEKPFRHVDEPGLAHPDNSDSPAWAVPSSSAATGEAAELAERLNSLFDAYLTQRHGLGKAQIQQELWDNKALIIQALRQFGDVPQGACK